MRRSSDIRTGLSVREVDVVVTPRVREEVQRHFGCDKVSLHQFKMKIGLLCGQILFFIHGPLIVLFVLRIRDSLNSLN